MHLHTIHQWLLLFYFYCFIGWIWESVYVSLGKHKWVNRGFLKEPFLPIYGSGAIVVLLSTLTVENNLILVFVIGMIGATILEYITGAVMEKIFHVRYWDYTDKPFNVNGHIRFTERNETIINIKKRIEVVEACVNEDVKAIQEKLIEKAVVSQEKVLAKKRSRKQAVEIIIKRNLESKEEAMIVLAEKISKYIDKFDELSSKAIDEPSKLKAEFSEYLSKLKIHEGKINNTESKVYINSINILNRNPNAKAKNYEEAMSEVKNLDKDLKEK